MPRPPRNPFYPVLGIVGFAFTVTAVAYCVMVLRGVRPRATIEPHALDRLMNDHGTTLLAAEIAVLAVATVGAIWLDHVAGEKVRRQRAARQAADPAGADQP